MKGYRQLEIAGLALTIAGVLVGCTMDNSPASTHVSGLIKITPSAQPTNDPYMTNTKVTNTSDLSNSTTSGLMLEKDAEIKMQTKADLFNDGQKETIALVNLPLIQGQDYSGYLGIWDEKGILLQKLPVNGYNILFPVKIYTNDLTQDRNPDIVLETDEHANGGNGVHHTYVYIQTEHHFVETPLPESPVTTFFASYQKKEQNFIIQSEEDPSRYWFAKINADQMQFINEDLLNEKQVVQMDPVSAIEVGNDFLTTKRWLWFGNLQLNNLGFLVTNYQYRDGRWQAFGYSIESSGSVQVSPS
ncbi:hypothetical protein B5M42_014525 [Paenibacillus athensensis]|uniref:Lipoprotein n=1 Tax=Paenibacillus athensensis TaxID=1967502 RepID=A0A4Y8Q8R5_9BACL|nr:hypothetical protein [Paenibacillus athensensis]MCD1260027.1 hypothetical protein [Paenibacillus athensensis]